MAYLCASCGSQTEDLDRCENCGDEARLDGRFRLDELLGRGSAGLTYRATRLDDDRAVCVKELGYSAMNSFEMKELFEREARVLRQLDHPGIPNYLDYFTVESDKNLSLYLVQEFVEGPDLESEMKDRRYAELEILELLEELADILTYLQELRPPVFHRDLKPSNVMRREESDRLVLVDFGSVKATTDGAVGGSTIAGTFGYMAPEQHWGKADPATDIYGLGALGLTLLSRREPKSFVSTNHRLAWKSEVEASTPIRQLFDGLLAHDMEERIPDADRAAERIRETRKRLETAVGSDERPRAAAEASPSEPDRNAPTESEEVHGTDETADRDVEGDVREVYGPEQMHSRISSEGPDWRRDNSACGTPLFTALAIGFAGLVGLLWLQPGWSPGDLFWSGREVETTAGVPIGPNTCPEEDCLPLDASSFDELEFEKRPADLRQRSVLLKETPSDDELSDEYQYRTNRVVAGHDATCHLAFGSREEGLRRYRCRIVDDLEFFEHKSATRSLLKTFMESHGRPEILREPKLPEEDEIQIHDKFDGKWVWTSERGTLELSVEYEKSFLDGALEPAEERQPDEPSTIFGDPGKPASRLTVEHESTSDGS